MLPMKIEIFDTTLRDGTQMEGFSLGVQDKITIAKALDQLGVDYIEGGWPASNPRDREFFEQMQKKPLRHSQLVAFAATHHPKFQAASECLSLKMTVECGAKVACIFGKTWQLHAEELLKISTERNLELITNSIKYLKDNGLKVIFDAEHFFDGWRDNPDFALACLRAAVTGGADNLTLCDTNGGSLPEQITAAVEAVKAALPDVQLGIHAHNDSELAVANSLAAIKAGTSLLQGTINGIGERCGNANLCSLLPNLELKLDYQTNCKLTELKRISMLVGARGNYRVVRNLPFVGKSAFAHKGGVHVSAVRKNPAAYEHIKPELVGNKRRATISDLSGKANLLSYAQKAGVDVEKLDDAWWRKLIKELKQKENDGIQFEGAEASFDLFFQSFLADFATPFTVDNFFVRTTKLADAPVEATVCGAINGKEFHTVGWGSGPVDALDHALRKGLKPYFPQIKQIKLTDFKVRITSMAEGTDAITRVVIEHSDGKRTWSTTGASQNIIEAAMQALTDAFWWYLKSPKFLVPSIC